MKTTLLTIAFAVATAFAAQPPSTGAKNANTNKPAATSKSTTATKKHHRKAVKKGATTASNSTPKPAAKK